MESWGHGYVMKASKMASSFARYGWGTYKSAAGIKDFKAGDVMSSSTHVYIVVGSCQDGSVVLVHSSPAGVRFSQATTEPTGEGRKRELFRSAKASSMKKYYPSWYRQAYPTCGRGMDCILRIMLSSVGQQAREAC